MSLGYRDAMTVVDSPEPLAGRSAWVGLVAKREGIFLENVHFVYYRTKRDALNLDAAMVGYT